MSQNGDYMTPLLNALCTAPISAILVKYAALTVALKWFTCFVPPSILEVACRVERGQVLLPVAQSELRQFESTINRSCPTVKLATGKSISYAKLRRSPITIFGGIDAGAVFTDFGESRTLSAGGLLKKYMNYTNVESSTEQWYIG